MENNRDQQEVDFEFPEDYQFFLSLLGKDQFDAYKFDFRDPKLKRRAFAKVNKSLMAEFLAAGRNKCELRLVESCNDADLVLDHIIPLSSNELNKR